MVKVRGQDIPSEILFPYKGSLRLAVDGLSVGGLYNTFKYNEKKYGSTVQYVQRRYPFRQPFKQDSSPHSPTKAQRASRQIFDGCRRCFKIQPKTGGVTPPALGPRNREYWYTSSGGSGLFYYDYFMKETLGIWYGVADPAKYPFTPVVPDWCKGAATDSTFGYKINPDAPQGGGYPQLVNAGWVLGDFTEEARAFFGYKGQPLSYISISGGFTVIPSASTDIYLEAWDVAEAWDETTLTWNNMPSLGKKLGEVKILNGVSPVEFSFAVSGKFGVALRFTPTSIPDPKIALLTITSAICGL